MATHTRCGQNGLFLSADEDRASLVIITVKLTGEMRWRPTGRKTCPTTNLQGLGADQTSNTAVTRLKKTD